MASMMAIINRALRSATFADGLSRLSFIVFPFPFVDTNSATVSVVYKHTWR
jgi:hypothetical protein